MTVADDLLKNDGKKFIEMMEQLAERRMAREEDARGQFDRGYDHANGDRYSHSHPPPTDEEEFEDEEEEYEEDDEEEYDSQEEEVMGLPCFDLVFFLEMFLLLMPGAGYYDGGATDGRRQEDVPDLCGQDV